MRTLLLLTMALLLAGCSAAPPAGTAAAHVAASSTRGDAVTGRRAAVKVLCVLDHKAASGKRRFERELSTCLALEHPNLIEILDGECSDERCFIVMELLEGQNLRQRLAAGRMKTDEAVGILQQVASALYVAHQAGVVHRDLKPENVFLTADGRIKILDFGISMAQDRLAITHSGLVKGTLSYLAPEQALGGVRRTQPPSRRRMAAAPHLPPSSDSEP